MKTSIRRPPSLSTANRPIAAVACVVVAGLLAALAVSARPAAAQRPEVWHPTPTTAPWQWQLQGKIDTSIPAAVYDVDGFETPKSTVEELHRQGRKVICYLDVGSWENYRPDASEFPRSVLGNKYQGFPNERWLDISRYQLFEQPLEHRFDMCASKGFDAVEPDNLAGWEPENKTGFNITRADQLRFNRWVADQVHDRGMAVALKNDGRQTGKLVGNFDFAIVEQCFQYEECSLYQPFIAAGKAVFEAEYELKPKQFCNEAEAIEFSSIRKSVDLFARPWQPCDQTGAPTGVLYKWTRLGR